MRQLFAAAGVVGLMGVGMIMYGMSLKKRGVHND